MQTLIVSIKKNINQFNNMQNQSESLFVSLTKQSPFQHKYVTITPIHTPAIPHQLTSTKKKKKQPTNTFFNIYHEEKPLNTMSLKKILFGEHRRIL